MLSHPYTDKPQDACLDSLDNITHVWHREQGILAVEPSQWQQADLEVAFYTLEEWMLWGTFYFSMFS